METKVYIDIQKWERVVYITQLIIAGCVFLVEIINNALLYVTRSQGYGPDTIVEKLIRYLLLTSIINFGSIIVGRIAIRRTKDAEQKKYIAMLTTVVMCTDVAFSHYQFACTLVIFVIPLMASILFEDISLTNVTAAICLIGQTIAVLARAVDPVYRVDIGPEAAIAYSFTISSFVFSRIILRTLEQRRIELSNALIESEKAKAYEERMKLSMKMFATLARTIDAKDRYTNGHSARVAIYSTILAKALGWDEKQIEILKYEALLHDIGKIGVPDEILNKPDKLSEAEFSLIQSHTLVGFDILKDMAVLPMAKDVAKYHHERYDGRGYPTRTEGESIPIDARIVCIADSYDAMNSDRIYRSALPKEVIREELVKGRGTQFDPDLVDVFLQLFDEHKLDVRVNSMLLEEADSDHESVMNDIERILRNFSELSGFDQNEINFRDYNKFYKYMRNIGLRYNHSIEVMSFKAEPKEGVTVDEGDDQAFADAMDVAIKKNIRAVDVYFKSTNLEHIIILMDAGTDNISVIAKRVIFDLDAILQDLKYDVNYYLNESIGNNQQ